MPAPPEPTIGNQEEFWKALLIAEDIAWQDACDEFAAILKGSVLPALNLERGSSFANVMFDPIEKATTHFLFKNPDNPKGERIRCDDHFQLRRAIRTKWIAEVLKDPDIVLFSTRTEYGPALIFARKTLPHERFVVVVGYVRPKMFFRTAYAMDLQDKDEKLHWDTLQLGEIKYKRATRK